MSWRCDEMSSNAAYAVMTKSRAKYGRRLTEKNYKDLLALHTVGEISSYLKTQTHYAPILANVQEAVIHRGNLEKFLRSKMFEDFANLCHFEESIGEHIFEYILLRGEINELLKFIQYYNAGHPEQYLFDLPFYFNYHTPIDLAQLSKVETFDELLAVFSSSPLGKIISNFRPVQGRTIDYMMLESALQKYLFVFTQKTFEKFSNKKERKELENLFFTHAELLNIKKIVRAKKYFHLSTELLSVQMIPYWRHFPKKQVQAMIQADDISLVDEYLKKSFYSKMLDISTPLAFIDEYVGQVLYKICRKAMRFSRYPSVVMISCINLFELEIEDVTNIIEGVRYQMPADSIRKLLIAYPN